MQASPVILGRQKIVLTLMIIFVLTVTLNENNIVRGANTNLLNGSFSPRDVEPIPSISFAGVADQHYGLQKVPIPPFDSETVDDWMSHPDIPELDFVVSSWGDWISDRRWGAWQDVTYAWEQITTLNADHQKIPYFFVIGNHDITNYDFMPADGNPVLKERLGRAIAGMNENNYAFLYNNVLFISAAQTNVLYTLSSFQRNWIEHLVSMYSDKTTVIWAHQATHETTGNGSKRATSWGNGDYRVHNDIDWWKDLFANNPQIKLYMHGHTEKAFNTTVSNTHIETWDDNVAFILVPSNGRPTHEAQHSWSYIFDITNEKITVRLWDSDTNEYIQNDHIGVPYVQQGNYNLKSTGMEWYSIPKRVLDGQSWAWKNKMIAESYQLEVIGRGNTEQIDNPALDGVHESDEDGGTKLKGYWYAVRGDEAALNKDTGEEDEYMLINGGNTVELAISPSNAQQYVEGKVPYNTAIAVANKTYVFSANIKTLNGTGNVDFLVSIPRQLTLLSYVWEDHVLQSNIPITNTLQTYQQTFTIPNDQGAWFIQPKIRFNDAATTYHWEDWSLKMLGDDDITKDFTITLNDETHNAGGALRPSKSKTFTITNSTINNDLNFNVTIGGNKAGIVRLIYNKPQLWSDDVSFGINNDVQTEATVEDVSPYNGHTTVMSFKDAKWGIDGRGFYEEQVRGKTTYLHNLNDNAINGMYNITTV